MEIGFSKKKSTKAQKNVRNDEIFEFPALFRRENDKKKPGKFIFSKSLWRTVNIANSFKFFVCFKIFDF